MFLKPLTILFLVQMMHLCQSAVVRKMLTIPEWKRLPFNSFGCQQGKVADVTLLLDTSQHLTDKQFENQIQRAEQMVRLFRNFKTNDRHRYNRIAIITISDSIVKHVVKFKSQLNSPKYSRTDELVHILRKLHKNNETYSISESRNGNEMLALKQLKRLSSQMRKEVAHVAFYFSADETVSNTDLKRAKYIRRLGIYLYIFRLGPSQITYDQYKKMVHEPVSDFVFYIKSYSDIDASVKKLLDMKHCDMQISPPDESPRPICVAKRLVNLLLGIDPITLDGSKTKKIQHFIQSLRKELEEANGAKILVEEVYNEFKLKPSESVKILTDYSDLLRKINETAASLSHKEKRKSAQKTVLLFLDSNSYETKEMIKRAKYIKDNKMEIYAIVIGKKINFSEIVSKPTTDHLLQVEDAEQLTSHKEEILKCICKGW